MQLQIGKHHVGMPLTLLATDYTLDVTFLIDLIYKRHTLNYLGTYNLLKQKLKFVIFVHLKETVGKSL